MKYDLTNQNIDEWTVIELANFDELTLKQKRQQKQRFWKCKCSCGFVGYLSSSQLMYKNRPNKMCAKCVINKKRSGSASPRYTGYEDLSGKKWKQILKHAVNRNISVEITIKDCWDLYIKQNKKCALTGQSIFFGNKANNNTASLDRIDSNKHYSIGNIQWIHKDVQRMKWDINQEKFLKLCYDITKYSFTNKITKE